MNKIFPCFGMEYDKLAECIQCQVRVSCLRDCNAEIKKAVYSDIMKRRKRKKCVGKKKEKGVKK